MILLEEILTICVPLGLLETDQIQGLQRAALRVDAIAVRIFAIRVADIKINS